ncbi:hypothetical protein [Paraburkholderia phytofirmans]|nr:hypothetical protein [Paraburkholderia phytofirmans]
MPFIGSEYRHPDEVGTAQVQQETPGVWAVDFSVNETDVELSVSGIKAVDAEHAERLAREVLNPQFTYRCTGLDRKRDDRD